jgi:hypothetical protein
MQERSPYETLLVLIAACIIIFLIYPYNIILWIALFLCATGLLFPSLVSLIHKAWFMLATLLGAITSRIILTVIYILLVLPIAFVVRKRLSINLKRQNGSYFKERNHTYSARDLDNVW